MLIQIKSDLHADAGAYGGRDRNDPEDKNEDKYVSEKAEAMILAGDTVSGYEPSLILSSINNANYRMPVILIPGNHEYDYSDVYTHIGKLKKRLDEEFNIHFLDRDYVIVDNVMFIGATLWTPNLTHDMNHWGCEGMTQDWHNKSFVKDFYFIKSMLEAPEFKKYKKVVITHFLPTLLSVPERFRDKNNEYFASDNCRALMHGEHAPALWVHGHTHDSWDYTEGDTRVVCNPYGRWDKNPERGDINPNYKPELLVEV